MVSIEELKLGNETLEALKFLLSQITELETAISQINISEIKDANTLTKEQIATLQDVKNAVEAISSDLSLKKTDFDSNMSAFRNDKADFDEKKADFDSKNNTALSNFVFISDNVEKINSTSALLAEAQAILEAIKPMEQRAQVTLNTIANSQAKFDELEALKTSLLELKRSLENISIVGLINDTSVSTTTTYSSKKIEDLVSNAKTTLTTDMNNQQQSITTLDSKINSVQNNVNSLGSSVSNALSQKIDKIDAYTKQESDRKFLKIGDYGLGRLNDMPILQNIDDTATPTGFYRAVENQTSGTFPQPYGGSRDAHVLVERVDANWVKQTITNIGTNTRTFIRTNNFSAKNWNDWQEVVTGAKDSTSSANSVVVRDANGDFAGRWITADHFRLRTQQQNNLFGESSEILFRGGASESANYVRAVSSTYMLKALLSARGDGIFFEGLSEDKGVSGRATFGYVRLPGGAILQFGMSHRMNPGETREQYFPVAFPTYCLCVLVSAHMPIPNDGVSAAQSNLHDNAKFEMQNRDVNSSMHIFWMAIGV